VPTTVEELVALVLSLRARVEAAEVRAEAAEARVAVLERENAELRARLGKDSSNSSKPPSSDSPYKSKPPVKRGVRKPGGQPGHKGSTREWLPPEKVDEHKLVRPSTCVCGASLEGVPAVPRDTWARQVVELPPIVPHVTEYRFETVQCPCCARVNAPTVPPEAATCTGPNLTALAATLVGEYHLSRDAAASLLGSVLNMPICAATVQDCCEQVSAGLQSATAEVDASLPSAARVHMDETSWRQRKDLRWLWIAISEIVTSFAIHSRRGRHQLAVWFPEGFNGVVTCDRWRPYEMFARRQLCWSHLEWDLQAIIDAASTGVAPATAALAGAGAMFTTWWRFKDAFITRADLQRDTQGYREQFKAFCLTGSGQAQDRRWRALGTDLLRQWDAVFLFLDVEGVEPTNNAAEQGLRSGVIWRRTTQGTRTDAGSTFVQRIMTAHANCKRQARSVLRFLSDTLMAHRQGITTPSLMPSGP
jgi:transposase